MSTNSSRPLPLAVIVFSLLLAGALLFAAVQDLNANIGPGTPANGAQPIHEAARTGDVATIQAALRRGVDVDAELDSPRRAERGMSPLMLACANDQLAAAETLVSAEADVNHASINGNTALIVAAARQEPALVEFLLTRGARLDARNKDGWTAAMMAAGVGSPETLDVLLAAGANVDARNKFQQTALMLAATSGDTRKTEALISAGAAIAPPDYEGNTALLIAAGSDAPTELLLALINAGADPNATNIDGVTPLMRAAERGDLDDTSLLLEAGASRDAADNAGRTAWDWAIGRDDDHGREVAKTIADHTD